MLDKLLDTAFARLLGVALLEAGIKGLEAKWQGASSEKAMFASVEYLASEHARLKFPDLKD